jgi:hypothetical protein
MSKMYTLYICLFYTAAYPADVPTDKTTSGLRLEIAREREQLDQLFYDNQQKICEDYEMRQIEIRDQKLVSQKIRNDIIKEANKVMFYIRAVSGLFGALALVGIGCFLLKYGRDQKLPCNLQ